MSLLTNEVYRIPMGGTVTVRLRVQTYDNGALCISTAPHEDETGELEALAAVDILRTFLLAEGREHRALGSRRGGAYVVDALIIRGAAGRADEFLRLVQFLGTRSVQ